MKEIQTVYYDLKYNNNIVYLLQVSVHFIKFV